MKTSILVVALLASSLSLGQAQYQIVDRGANYRVLQKTSIENGTNRIHRVVELGSGLHYKNSYGQWVESKEEIDTYPSGAVARRGAFQVIFANNLNSAGAIDLQTPDGKRLRTSILGLAYDDRSTGKNVLIAQIQDSQGELISANQVLYPNAFDGVVKADIRYTYRKGSFEQDVILRERPPAPEAFELNPQTTEIEVITEFIDPPQAKIVEHKSKNSTLPDDDVDWGVARIGHGKAFDLGEPRNSPSQATVRRQYISAQGRHILVEGVPIQRIKGSLAKLPLQSSTTTKLPMLASETLALPKTPLAQAEQKPMMLALASPSNKGFVLDYVLVDTDPGDFTFAADTTYYVANGLDFSGNLTFEGGTVIKYGTDPNNPNLMECWGDMVCDTAPDRPAIFTSINDDTVGEPISDPNMPLKYYWCAMAGNSSSAVVWHDVCVRYARVGFDGYALQLHDCQFVDCLYPFMSNWGTCSATNVLIVNADSAFTGIDFNAVAYNVTVDNCTNLTLDWWGHTSDTLALTNSLLVNVQAGGDATITTNHTAWVTDSGRQVFQTGGGGDYYLKPSSPFIDAGNVTADQVGLDQFTTQTSQGLEGTSIVDLGYHYYPVAYVDSDNDGLPDWWEMYWFGNLTHSGSDLDSGGVNTLLTDYQNYINGITPYDPNVIAFALFTTNNYVNTSLATVQVSVSSGVPSHQAVLVNSTNFAGATWTSYTSSNLTMNLGSLNEGDYAVWVGLKGLPDDATQTWHEIDFTIDTTSPLLVITNPTTSTLGIPLVQVQGYAGEQLAAFTFDVSNATGVVTGQQGIIMSQDFDTNRWKFTTNHFQCYDITLTPGANIVTLHATDFAGNTTTSNLLLNLDFSTRTNLPVVALTFPQDGLKVSGTNFTLDGFVDDPTATVTAQMVDTNGGTNVLSGEVERTGRFWVDNLPLGAGNNQLTLSVTDAAGNSTNLTMVVVQSAVVLTINPLADPNQLWQPAVNLTGTVGDASATVTVNGTNATVAAQVNGAGTYNWSAANVPVTPGGVACFTALATAEGQTQAADKSSPVKPDTIGIVVWHDEQTLHEYYDDLNKEWWYDQCADDFPIDVCESNENWTTSDMSQHWDYTNGCAAANSSIIGDGVSGGVNDQCVWVEDPPWHSSMVGNWQFLWPDPIPYDYLNATWTGGDTGPILNKLLGCEVCDVQNNYDMDYWNPNWWEEIIHHTYTRHACTVLALLSGGRAIPGRQILHEIHGWAKHIPPPYADGQQPPYYYQFTWFNNLPGLPNGAVHLLANTLHDPDGSLYYVTYAGQDPVQFTPTVAEDKFYVFGYNDEAYNIDDTPSFTDSPHVLIHLTQCTAAGNPDNSRTTIGVGEKVDFSGMPDNTTWSVSGNGTISSTTGSGTTFTASLSPGRATVTAQVGTATQPVTFNIIAPSGIGNVSDYQDVGLGTEGANHIGAFTKFSLDLLPTTVNFGNVSIREDTPTSPVRHWPNGDLTQTPANVQDFPAGGNCAAFNGDDIAYGKVAPVPIAKLSNGTSYVDFSFPLDWTDEYLNASGEWIQFANLEMITKFRGADQACQVIYQNVPGRYQGPWQ